MEKGIEMKTVKALEIAEQGFFWVGIEKKTLGSNTFAHNAMGVFYQKPVNSIGQTVVMVHGGGGQGLDFMTTPDGRPGWAQYFLQQGYDVYVVDRPGMGRSPYNSLVDGEFLPSPSYEMMQGMMLEPEKSNVYPQAKLHTQWPVGQDTLNQFMASQGPMPSTLARAQEDMARCGVELLKKIGPAYLITHSMGGPFGWLVADRCPKLVKAIMAVEPFGPPFAKGPANTGELEWGITAIPMTYAPEAKLASDIAKVLKKSVEKNTVDCYVQQEPARQLINLKNIPIAIMTGEASWMAQHNHGMTEYLQQAGVAVEHLRLENYGIHGNGHMLLIEKNSHDIANFIHNWFQEK